MAFIKMVPQFMRRSFAVQHKARCQQEQAAEGSAHHRQPVCTGLGQSGRQQRQRLPALHPAPRSVRLRWCLWSQRCQPVQCQSCAGASGVTAGSAGVTSGVDGTSGVLGVSGVLGLSGVSGLVGRVRSFTGFRACPARSWAAPHAWSGRTCQCCRCSLHSRPASSSGLYASCPPAASRAGPRPPAW